VWLLFKCGDIFNIRSKAKNPYVQESNKMKSERETLGHCSFGHQSLTFVLFTCTCVGETLREEVGHLC